MSRLIFTLLMLLPVSVPIVMADTAENGCSAWYSTACWAHILQNCIDNARDVPDGMKQYGDAMLSSVYRAGQGVNAVAYHAGEVLKKAYDTLVATQQQVCVDDDLYFVEAVAVIAAAILAVELTMTSGTSGGSGALALKALLIAQAPKLMSKLHERLCGSPFTTDDPNLITKVESAIDKALSGK
jgi:hypothetical protein